MQCFEGTSAPSLSGFEASLPLVTLIHINPGILFILFSLLESTLLHILLYSGSFHGVRNFLVPTEYYTNTNELEEKENKKVVSNSIIE